MVTPYLCCARKRIRCLQAVCPSPSAYAEMTSKVYELDLRGQKIERIENLEKVCFM